MFELLETEQRVAECNALIERQRRLIEESRYQECDMTSAQIVFDSLCISLSLHLQDRRRLREANECLQLTRGASSTEGKAIRPCPEQMDMPQHRKRQPIRITG